MKASELKKKCIGIDAIFKQIKATNENGYCKYNITDDIFVSDEVKLKLMENGFKVYKKEICGCGYLVVEW